MCLVCEEHTPPNAQAIATEQALALHLWDALFSRQSVFSCRVRISEERVIETHAPSTNHFADSRFQAKASTSSGVT